MFKDNTVKSVYIHIPFCKKICSYCDFCKNYYDENVVKDYLVALDKEIISNYNNEVINTLYVGGGTPSSLNKEELVMLFNILKRINLNNDYEFTFECNYDDIDEELLSLLKNNGVNRLSIGIQTFNEKYENILNRSINKDDMINSVKLSKKYFDNINIDLIYALPGESNEDLISDLTVMLELDVKHISTYCLINEEHTMLRINNVKELSDDEESDMYYKIISVLKKHGYNHYEISNFSKEGYESRHNLTYWNSNYYYGFGAGASGYVNNARYDNTKSVFSYIKGNTKAHEWSYNEDEWLNDYVMLALRKIKGICKKDFYKAFGKPFNDVFDIKDLVSMHLLIDDGDYVYIPENKLFISNEIIIRTLDS